MAVETQSCLTVIHRYCEGGVSWKKSHTQNIHATFILQRLLDDVLRLLGNVSHQSIHGGGIDTLLNNHLYFLCDCLDLRLQVKNMLMMS